MYLYRFLLLLTLFSVFVNAQFEPLQYELSSNNTKSVLIDNRSLIWVGTDEGLNLNDQNDNFIFYSNIKDSLSLLNSEIMDIFQLHDQYVGVLSKGGISVFDPKKIALFN